MADSTLKDIRSDLLSDQCKTRDFELKGHELRIREMTLAEYEDLTDGLGSLLELTYRESLSVIVKCVTDRDGQKVFGPEHLDTFLEGPARADSTAKALNRQFLIVNGFVGDPSELVDEGDEDGDTLDDMVDGEGDEGN